MRHRKHVRPQPSRLDPALVEAIRHIPVPAFVVSTYGEVIAMNPAGHTWLEERPAHHSALCRTAGPDPDVFRVTSSRDARRGYNLAVLRQPSNTRRSEPLVPPRWGLTPREVEVVACIARGLTNQQIASELGCALGTVVHHITSILRKADVSNRASLIVAVIASGDQSWPLPHS
jgi:DNA-binding CsgD family transcriptional regulator